MIEKLGCIWNSPVLIVFFWCFDPSGQITINRPERRNSFRPQTVKELMKAFNDARDDITIGVIIFTGTVCLLQSPSI